jgi:hypothetical protein
MKGQPVINTLLYQVDKVSGSNWGVFTIDFDRNGAALNNQIYSGIAI